MKLGRLVLLLLLLLPGLAAAQSVSIDLGAGGSAGATARRIRWATPMAAMAAVPWPQTMIRFKAG